MTIDVSLAPVADILRLRDLSRAEMNCQIVLDSWPERGWTDSYLLRLDGRIVGYGAVGDVRAKRKDIVTEFFVLPDHRAAALPLFQRFVEVSGARRMEVQSNDTLLTLMLYDCATRIKSNVILFHDGQTTALSAASAKFRQRAGIGDCVLEVKGEVAATGGVLFHYNVPFGDIYMEVAAPFRRRGLGGYLVQELKRACYENGRIPAARCNATNAASRATLQKAGMIPCARVLTGALPK